MPDLMGVKEAARYLGISRRTVWLLMASGKLRWYTVEGIRGRRFKSEDLDALIREGKRPGRT